MLGEPAAATRPATAHTPRVVTLVPLVALAALPLVALRFGTDPVSDPDTLWHVLLGRRLWETWQFAGPDPLGTPAPLPFVYHQWLPELAMAAADAVAGLPGVAWLFTATLVGFVLTVYALCRRQAGMLAALLATVTTWLGASGSLSPRPQVVGFVLLAVCVGAWLRFARDGRIRWWLVPLQWLWACVHGTWVYGVALAVVFSLGAVLDHRPSRARLVRLGALVAALVAVAMVTPVGPRLLLTPASVTAVSRYIQEWQPTRVSDPSALATVLMALVVVLVWVRARRRVPWSHVLPWVLAVGSALVYARTIAVGAVLLAPLFAEAVQRAVPVRPVGRRTELATAAGAAVVSLVLAAVLVPIRAPQPGGVPNGFDADLTALPAGTVVWNVDALGGWLLYAHPNLRPTIDTRAEVYGPDYVDRYVRAIGAYPGWPATIAQSGARYALVAADGPLGAALQRQAGWVVVRRDPTYLLLRAP